MCTCTGVNVPVRIADEAASLLSSERVVEEIPVPVGVIWSAWRLQKISDADVQKELIRSRDRGAVQALNDVRVLIRHADILNREDEISRVQATLESAQKTFRCHATVSEFMAQFTPDRYGVDGRKKALVLLGATQEGKSMKAISLFKNKHTLKVSCQGLPYGVLPGLGAFDRAVHKAIVWDEIRMDQVLRNREIFQSNQFTQTLQQSVCNQHAFDVWLYHTAQILCTNNFNVEGVANPADKEWLTKNMWVVKLGPDQKWYFDT